MITILARKHIRNDAQGRDIARVYISVSAASELPAQDAIPNIIIAEGSKAWDISTGDEYGFIVGQGWNKQAGGGVSDYEELENLPQINSVTLIGNKNLSDLGIVNPMMLMGRVDTVADLQNIPNPQTGWLYLVGFVSEAQKAEYVYTANDTWELMGYNTIVIDSALSTTSENPVQNKVITNAMVGEKTAGKQYVIDGQTVTAGDGAEVFNDYASNKAAGEYSHAEGGYNTATGIHSHVEGRGNTASGDGAHAEGAGGVRATASGSHAEGQGSVASSSASHAEGMGTTASGFNSHAEGAATTASGWNSHAEGGWTIAASSEQHVQGKYNVSDSNGIYAFIIGNGTSENARHNAFAIDWNGNIYVNGSATGVNVETLSSILTPISESAYEALTTKDKPLYFIYDT